MEDAEYFVTELRLEQFKFVLSFNNEFLPIVFRSFSMLPADLDFPMVASADLDGAGVSEEGIDFLLRCPSKGEKGTVTGRFGTLGTPI